VLIYDDAGDHAGMQAAEVIAASGAKLEIMTRDRAFAPEAMAMAMAMNPVPYMRALQKRDVKFTVTNLVEAVRKDGNMLVATIGSDYGGIAREQRHDQVIVNHGTRPNDSLYLELTPHSVNEGAVNHSNLIDGKPQLVFTNPAGKFQLFRIGDAVAARNTHAAIYDALRLVKDI
jgi:NADPH-dependent 2,4-dienoyl-CoA reductase/sulfur reductase-like enzyme